MALKPKPLCPGDTIAIAAPAGPIDPAALARGCEVLRSLGYAPVFLDSITDRDRYFAGSVARRLDELQGWFADPKVSAIVCARGGYGCNYLLPHLDFELIRRHPKILVGLSDVTTLLTAIHDRTCLITFHGPMAAAHFARENGIDLASWRAAVGGEAGWSIPAGEPLVRGSAEGAIYGGCLSLMVQSLGTPWEIRTSGSILFLEDVNEPAYRIDRMLMHLKLAGKLEGVQAIVLGWELVSGRDPIGTECVVQNVLGDLGIPVALGLSSGHVDPTATLPIGVRARLDCTGRNAQLTMLESATQSEAGVEAVNTVQKR